MGSFLSSPKIECEDYYKFLDQENQEKELNQHYKLKNHIHGVYQDKNDNFHYAVGMIQGWRQLQEDGVLARANLEGEPDLHLFAVFDGHGGPQVSTYLIENFLLILQKQQGFKERNDFEKALTDAIYEIDETICTEKGKKDLKIIQDRREKYEREYRQGLYVKEEPNEDEDATDKEEDEEKVDPVQKYNDQVDQQIENYLKKNQIETVGCTGNIVLIYKNDLYCMNVGDSKSAIGYTTDHGQVQCLYLSNEQKPDDPEDKERIVNAGGKVKDGRVEPGGLAVARAFGDEICKWTQVADKKYIYEDYRQCTEKKISPDDFLMTCKPSIKKINLGDYNLKFLILACDGIWECENHQLLKIIGTIDVYMKDYQTTNLQKLIVQELIPKCVAKNTIDAVGSDNMSVILMQFNPENQNKKK